MGRSGREALVVLGTSTASLEVADLAQAQGYRVAGLVAVEEVEESTPSPASLLGLPVLSWDEARALAPSHLAVVGVEEGRREIASRASGLGFRFASLRHPSSYVAHTTTLEQGSAIGAAACVAGYSAIGPHALLCQGAMVGHHTTIGAYAVIGAGANVAGSCRVEEEARVGPGARVIHRIAIGAGAVVEAGAVVIEDVPSGSRVSGVPARASA